MMIQVVNESIKPTFWCIFNDLEHLKMPMEPLLWSEAVECLLLALSVHVALHSF
jgi:hypothetical protein